VIGVEGSLSFGEFDAATARVQARLDSLGIDGPVPVLVDRSVATVVAVAGCVRAGRAYAPIDAAAPPERVGLMVQRLGSPELAVVTSSDQAERLGAGMEPLLLDDPFVAAPREATWPDPAAVDPQALGVVVFSSGSTGRPKVIWRRWEVFARSHQDQVVHGIPVADGHWRWAAIQPFSFGGSRALSVPALGGTLVLADPATMTAAALARWFEANAVVEANLVPSLVSALDHAAAGRRLLPSLVRVNLGGEASQWPTVQALRQLIAPSATIFHEFGSSESGRVFMYPIAPDHPGGSGPVPLGQPLPRRRVRLEPVQSDASITELWVADPDSAGYLGDPALEAARFHVDESGTRWWSSGDLFRVEDHSGYVHRGRVDDLVKINGLLIEPREVEMALAAVPGVAGAAVVSHVAKSGHLRLVGHVVISDPALTPDKVRATLGARLPAHMVSGILMRHDQLPLTDRGKVDRVALAQLPLDPWREGEHPFAFFGRERAVAEEAARLLGLDVVYADEDLWGLGLDSLDAVELCARLEDVGVGVAAPTVLATARTPAALATVLGEHSVAQDGPMVFNPSRSRPAMVGFAGAGGTALAFRELADLLGPSQPVAVVEPRGLHRPGRPHRRIEPAAREALEMLAPWLGDHGCTTVFGHSAGATMAWEVARQLDRAGRSVRLVLLDGVPGHAPGMELDPASTSARPSRRRVTLASVGPILLGRARRQLRRVRARYDMARGRPTHDATRYLAMRAVMVNAVLRYRPQPVTFPVQLVIVAGHESLADVVAPLAPSLEVVTVTGDHLSMLRRPAVAEVVRVLAPPRASNGGAR